MNATAAKVERVKAVEDGIEQKQIIVQKKTQTLIETQTQTVQVQSVGQITTIDIFMGEGEGQENVDLPAAEETIVLQPSRGESTSVASRGPYVHEQTSKDSILKEQIPQADFDLLARVIYAEARGEDFEGQVAVGAVVLNRLKDANFPKTIQDVVYQAGAFTAVNDKQIHLTPGEEAYRAAEAALSGLDPTGGAIYYFNPKTATDRWIKTRPVIKRIGNHTFSI